MNNYLEILELIELVKISSDNTDKLEHGFLCLIEGLFENANDKIDRISSEIINAKKMFLGYNNYFYFCKMVILSNSKNFDGREMLHSLAS